MQWLDDLKIFLDGKKTIIAAVVAGIDAVGMQLNWWQEGKVRQIFEIVMVVVFQRLGTTKSGPVDTAPVNAPPAKGV